MKTIRPLTVATLLVPTLLLAACGGGDDEDASGDGGTSATTAAEPTQEIETGIPLIPGDPCDVDVTLTGAVRKTFTEKGAVSLDDAGGPTAVYQVTDGESVVTAYAAGNGFQTSVIVNDGTESYGSSTGAPGLEIADDGSGATIDTDVAQPGKPRVKVKVEATFTC